jgi:hypothetical protein
VLSPTDSNHRRLLLGTRDWQRPGWIERYYPPDIPQEWRLAYYGNDADCVLLPASVWADSAPGIDEQLEEAPEHLLFFLEAAHRSTVYDVFERRFRGRPAVVLEDDSPLPDGIPSWSADPAGGWRDPESRGLLFRLSLAEFDLRALRRDIESLSPEIAVLILEGPAASPAQLGEVRTLIELLGRG